MNGDRLNFYAKAAGTRPWRVVAGRFVVAFRLGARAVVVGGPRLVVRCRSVRAAADFVLITNAIPVGIIDAIAVTIDFGRWVFAGTVIVGGCSVKVASRSVCTTWDFVLVTDAIAIGVIQANPVAIQTIRRVDTFVVVEVLTSIGDVQGDAQFIGWIAVQEDLQVHLAFEGAIGGELPHKDPQVFTRHSICLAVQSVPRPANRIGDVQISSGFKIRHPVVLIGSNHARGAFTGRRIRRSIQADGHPTVGIEFWEEAEQRAVQVAGHRGAHCVLVESRGGVDKRGELAVAGYAGQEVVSVGQVGVDPVSGVAGQVS